MTSRGSKWLGERVSQAAYDRARAAAASHPFARAASEAVAAGHYARAAYSATEGLRDYGRGSIDSRGYAAPGCADSSRTTGEDHDQSRRPLWVGGELWHGADERKQALARLATAWSGLQNDLAISGTGPGDAEWVNAVVVPELAEWHQFVTHVNESDLSIMTVEWQILESWLERLRRLRMLARTRGIRLVSPDPVDLPKTIWERGGSGTGSAADTLLSFGRVAVFSVIGVVSFVGFFSIVREWRRRAKDEHETQTQTPSPSQTKSRGS